MRIQKLVEDLKKKQKKNSHKFSDSSPAWPEREEQPHCGRGVSAAEQNLTAHTGHRNSGPGRGEARSVLVIYSWTGVGEHCRPLPGSSCLPEAEAEPSSLGEDAMALTQLVGSPQ